LTLEQFKVIDLGVNGKPICDFLLAGLPWGWHFNPHTHPIPTATGIPIGIPMGIPIPTEPEV